MRQLSLTIRTLRSFEFLHVARQGDYVWGGYALKCRPAPRRWRSLTLVAVFIGLQPSSGLSSACTAVCELGAIGIEEAIRHYGRRQLSWPFGVNYSGRCGG